jgi:hypothetical protein
MVETQSDEILRDAATEDVSLLVVGDPFGWVSLLPPSFISLRRHCFCSVFLRYANGRKRFPSIAHFSPQFCVSLPRFPSSHFRFSLLHVLASALDPATPAPVRNSHVHITLK